MKTIKIKKLSLTNFKGIKNLTIDFENETGILGANGTGKTTIFDAFTWLLFGKDSNDRTAFEIKTLDKNNKVIQKIDHEVEAILDVDVKETTIRRTFKEKWVKRRGSLESEFSGNETLYHWNDVPVLASEFSQKISGMIEESIFKLLTNPLGFNSLKWQDQRQLLIEISGGITDSEIAGTNKEYQSLLEKLTDKTLEEYKKQIAASVRKSKDELKMLPTRIDEVERGKPEALNFDDLRYGLEHNEKKLAEIDNQISDKTSAQQDILNQRRDVQQKIFGLESEMDELRFKIKQEAAKEFREATAFEGKLQEKLDQKQEELKNTILGLEKLEGLLKNEKLDIETYSKKNDGIRAEWTKRNAEEFQMDDKDCKCPTCQRAFETSDIEAKRQELQTNFQNSKTKDLTELTVQGQRNAGIIEKAQAEIKVLDERIAKGSDFKKTLLEEIETIKESIDMEHKKETRSETDIYYGLLEDNQEIKSKTLEVEKLKKELEGIKGVNVDDLKAKKEETNSNIQELKTKLAAEDQIKKANERIAQLEKEEGALAQVIADYEKEQYIIENFTKAKIDHLEGMINARFEQVKFKMFETQVNGAEVETCKALVDGVPFSDLNNAARINAGLDIIRTLSKHFEVSAPIIIDNRESVTNLINIDSQIISLIVSPTNKKLRVESWGKELQTV